MRASPRSTSPRARCGRRCRCGTLCRAPALTGRERAQGTVSASELWRKGRVGQSKVCRCCRALRSCGRVGEGGGRCARVCCRKRTFTMLMLGHGSPKTLRRAICCFHMAEGHVNVDLVPIPALWGPSRKGWDFRPKAWQTLPLTQASLSALNHPRAVSDRGAPARCRPVPNASSALPNQPLSSLPHFPLVVQVRPRPPLSVSFCTQEVCG